MAIGNLEPCLKLILKHEGGYSSDPKDPGNWTGGKPGQGSLRGTKFGIAANTYPGLDIKNLTWEVACGIYRRDFANAIRFDELPRGVDYAVLDFAINSGRQRAVVGLQRALGVADDGKLGRVTLTKLSTADQVLTIEAICDERLAFMKRLSIWKTYARGWTARVEGVRKDARAMALRVPVPGVRPPVIVAPKPAPAVETRGFWARLFGALRA